MCDMPRELANHDGPSDSRQEFKLLTHNYRGPGPVTSRELWGWYLYDAAYSSFYSVAAVIFFPLFLSSLAASQAWWQAGSSAPPQCSDTVTSDCVLCVAGSGEQLKTSTGYTAFSMPKLWIGSLAVQPVSYATAVIGIAVLLQVLVFITFAPMADFGHGRRKLLIIGMLIATPPMIATLAVVSSSLYWLAAILLIISTVGYGLACVSYNSYLAVLVEAHPTVIEAEDSGKPLVEVVAIREQAEDRISLMGTFIASAITVLITAIASALTLATESESLQMRLAICFCGVWWLAVGWLSLHLLGSRPGPPKPPGLSSFAGWHRLWHVLGAARKYKQALIFVVCYFVYADGYTTIMQIAALFAQTEMCIGNTLLILLAANVSVFAAIGAVCFILFHRFTGLSNKSMVCLTIAGMLPLPLWALLGYLTPPGSFGMKQVWELYVFTGWYGFCLGPLLAFSRALFIDLIPLGQEATFFCLYGISDKGSSWVGPLVAAAIAQGTGSLRPAFIFVFLVLLVPLVVIIFFLNHKQGIKDARRVPETAPLDDDDFESDDNKRAVVELSGNDH